MPQACASSPATPRSCAAGRRRSIQRAIAVCVHEVKQAGSPRGRAAGGDHRPRDRPRTRHLQDQVDVIMPRGGKSLIERVRGKPHPGDQAPTWRVPRLSRRRGGPIAGDHHRPQCENAAPASAIRWKRSLIARSIAKHVMPRLPRSTRKRASRSAPTKPRAARAEDFPATDEDWYTEYLDPIISVRVVDGLEQAIEHIKAYSSQHTDAIVTEDPPRAQKFLTGVDSASVIVNASTRFTDGTNTASARNRYFHRQAPCARPGRPRRMTSLKYVVFGEGQIRT